MRLLVFAMSGVSLEIEVRAGRVFDADALARLEGLCYPPDEAASLERFRQRLSVAPECTLVGERSGEVVGFVCGTRSAEETLTHESMSAHESAGASLCIHSVVVDPSLRRRGLALELLRAYAEHASRLDGVERLLLICKAYLIELYSKAGFELVGPSDVVHGRDPWFEMKLVFEGRSV